MSDELTPRTSSTDVAETGPMADPGLPAHQPRLTDIDPAAEKRAERQIAAMFGISSICTILFVVAYFTFEVGENPDTILGYGASTLTLGLTFGLALLLIGIGIVQWSRKLMDDHEIVEMRHPTRSSDEDRAAVLEALDQGIEESGVKRRPLVVFSLLGAVGTALLPAVVLLRDLGPLPGRSLYSTIWRPNMRVVRDVSGAPIAAADVELGELYNAEPEIFFDAERYGEEELSEADLLREKAKAAVILVRIPPEDTTPMEGRENWGYEGILCFSKICTHVGCPISLYEQQTHHLLCPCHQSTFDLSDGGKVVFGPAARALPQLRLDVDSEGNLVAVDDFDEPTGPSFWERG